jgi:hypothetical protein
MDLRVYYQKIRDWDSKIADEFPVVKSKETTDGGKDGTLTEVSKHIAAKLIVDGMADLAEDADLEKFRADMAEAKRAADAKVAAATAMQLAVVPKQELDELRAHQARGAKE